MTNYMREIAGLLGVELGESFKIVDDNSGKYHNYYRLTEENGIEVSDDNADWEMAIAGVLKWLLIGDARIIKIPWKPQDGKQYHVPRITVNPECMYDTYCWNGNDYDEEYYRMGLVCKTSEEAVAMTKKMLTAVQEQAVE